MYRLLGVFLAVLASPAFAMAVTFNFAGTRPDNAPFASVPDMLTRIINFLLIIAGIAFVLLFLVGGITYLTAGGDKDGEAKAKRMLANAVIGLIITLSAFAVATFIYNYLTKNENRLKIDPINTNQTIIKTANTSQTLIKTADPSQTLVKPQPSGSSQPVTIKPNETTGLIRPTDSATPGPSGIPPTTEGGSTSPTASGSPGPSGLPAPTPVSSAGTFTMSNILDEQLKSNAAKTTMVIQFINDSSRTHQTQVNYQVIDNQTNHVLGQGSTTEGIAQLTLPTGKDIRIQTTNVTAVRDQQFTVPADGRAPHFVFVQ